MNYYKSYPFKKPNPPPVRPWSVPVPSTCVVNKLVAPLLGSSGRISVASTPLSSNSSSSRSPFTMSPPPMPTATEGECAIPLASSPPSPLQKKSASSRLMCCPQYRDQSSSPFSSQSPFPSSPSPSPRRSRRRARRRCIPPERQHPHPERRCHLEVVKWLHANRKEGCTKDAAHGLGGVVRPPRGR